MIVVGIILYGLWNLWADFDSAALDGARWFALGWLAIGVLAGSVGYYIGKRNSDEAGESLKNFWRECTAFDEAHPLPTIVRARYGESSAAIRDSHVVQGLCKYLEWNNIRSNRQKHLGDSYVSAVQSIFGDYLREHRRQRAEQKSAWLDKKLREVGERAAASA